MLGNGGDVTVIMRIAGRIESASIFLISDLSVKHVLYTNLHPE
jgi:hypothetical protein